MNEKHDQSLAAIIARVDRTLAPPDSSVKPSGTRTTGGVGTIGRSDWAAIKAELARLQSILDAAVPL